MKAKISTISIILIITVIFFQNHLFGLEKKVLLPDSKLGRQCKILSNTVYIRYKSGIDVYNPPQTVISGNPIVNQKSMLSPRQSITFNNKLRTKAQIQSSNINGIMQAEEPLLRTFVVEYEGDEAPEEYCKKLLKNPLVEIAEPYCIAELQASINDPYHGEQNYLLKIGAYDAWDYCQGDTSVIIGISDVGIDQEHEDLRDNIAPNWGESINPNDSDDDHNDYKDDYRGCNLAYLADGTAPWNTSHWDSHGTEVAGIAGASTNNGKGVAGVGYKCRIFPIKAELITEDGITYGYESIIYAAVRRFKVLNLSWGIDKQYSDIEQSIIDYAVACDVAIVAAGGNYRNDVKSHTEIFYPAGYRGVLGVGETTADDTKTDGSMMGQHVRIMAPGEGNYTTTLNNRYIPAASGTSFSSPVVAGAVALFRSKYPQLNAMQSLEFTRQCTDDITGDNYSWRRYIPGRINLLKGVTTDPFSIPAITPISIELRNAEGVLSERFPIGELISMKINAYNYLGNAENLKFVLSTIDDNTGSITIIDSIVNISKVNRESWVAIENFKYQINKSNTEKIFFRVDISADNNYHDFFIWQYYPTVEFTNFSNKAIKFSMHDRGIVGTGASDYNFEGLGFVYKNKGNQIYKAGLLATENMNKIVSSYWGAGPLMNDFRAEKKFIYPDVNIGIFNDSNAGTNQIGLQISQRVGLPKDNDSATMAKIDVTVKNISLNDMSSVAVGYYFDWDIGPNSDSNYVKLLLEAVPSGAKMNSFAAEIAGYMDGFPVFGAASYSLEEPVEAQAAGFETQVQYYDRNRQIASLNSGNMMQVNGYQDIKMVVGMKFPGFFPSGQERKFCLCFGGADNETEFINAIKKCLDTNYVSVTEQSIPDDLHINIYPQPAIETATIKIESPFTENIKINIFDILGNKVFPEMQTSIERGFTSIPLNVKGLNSGMYLLAVKFGESVIVKRVLILN